MSIRYKEYSRKNITTPPPQPTQTTPLSPTYSRPQAQQAIATRQPVAYTPTQREEPLIPEGYKIVGVEPTPSGFELTLQKTTTETVAPQKVPNVPTHMNDPISRQVFKGIAETQKMQADPAGYILKKTVEIGAAATGLGAPAIAVKGALIGYGITQGIVGVTERRVLSTSELKEAVFGGAAFSGVSSVVFGVSGLSAMEGVKGVAARAGASAGLVGGAGYVFSGGKLEAAAYGAAFGAGFSLAGEAVGYAYPRYVKPALGKVYEKMFPERSMYKRVVAPQEPSQSLTERIIGKVSPERALYKRVTSVSPKDVIDVSDVPSGTYQTPSGFAKQTLLVKQVTQKATMKPFLPTLQLSKQAPVVALALTRTAMPKTTTKTQAKTATAQRREITKTIQQQVVNPFSQYQGAPYYRQRSREQEEYAYIVYPRGSPLAAPSIIAMPSLIQRGSSLSRSIIDQAPKTALDPFQTDSQIVQQTVNQTQVQRQVQQQVQELLQTQRQKQDYKRDYMLGSFDMPQGFTRISKEVFGGSKWFLRKNPLISTKQMLKEVFG